MTEVVAALIWDGCRFLACQRPAHKARGLLWEFVGGKVEPGETKDQALKRECMEELQIEVDVYEPFMELVHEYPDLTVRLTLLNASIRSGTPTLLEHNAIRWITTAQIDSLEFCPADVEILRALKTVDGFLHARLYALRDEKYKAFFERLLPGVDKNRLIGVRVPALRRIAKDMTDEHKATFLTELPHRYYDENVLHAILINSHRDFDQVIDRLNSFLPCVDNWAVCDSISPEVFRKNHERLYPHVLKWLHSEHIYTVRFAVNMLMKHYLEEDYRPEHMYLIAAVPQDAYYVSMAAAWYVATALAKQYRDAEALLKSNALPAATHNRAIRKALESRLISRETGMYLRSLIRDN